ncbi:universal stress protein [Cohnella phaseoli]|uniref:Universal stress protein family protein n=1 Tax=Cohnella phaseoli TaxID=456490 RepID=A0A3D9KRH5_9BACL|nr:universal stress protein [Cohnella phaseoli]RED89227.1 universal stress protein family protein [Cohnella phaseoli]
MISSEKIMVCVYHGPNSENLIRRGGKLASMIRCPLYVLGVIPERLESPGSEQKKNMSLWQTQCDKWRATCIIKSRESRKTAEVIAETVKELEITQLILGQPGQTRLQEIMNGSIVTELMKRIVEVDMHIVSAQRMASSLKVNDEENGE